MAVDSLRDTFHINRVEPDEIGLLLSAQSYRTEITKAVRDIKTSANWLPLQSVCNNKISPGPHPKYGRSGHPCLKTRNVLEILISKDSFDWVPFHLAEPMKRFFVKNADILLNLTGAGSIGRVSIYYGYEKPLTNQHIARLSIEKAYDPAYICSFLSSWWGERIIEQGISGSTGQLNLVNDHVRTLPVLLPGSKVQKYIGDKVRQAERLRKRSKIIGLEIKDKMQRCFKGKTKPSYNKFSTVAVSKLTNSRLESEFYTPLVLWAEEEIRGTPWSHQPLSNLTHRIKDGPGGWGVSTNDYVTSGIPVIRAVNLIGGVCNLSKCVFITPQKHQDLISHEAIKGSVLLSVRGTVGRAAVFESEDYEKANLNAAVVTLDCKEEILPHYLAAFLNTEIGKVQSNRIANGAVQLNMNLTEVGTNLIVLAPMKFQEEVSTLRKKRLLLEDLSHKSTVAAKLLVEALIEGAISEVDFVEAQKGLEQGNTSLDREILAQLTRKGTNHPGEPPLFSDLDILYEALSFLNGSMRYEKNGTVRRIAK